MTEREKFIHVQVDVDLFDHPKSSLVGEGGVAVYLAALAYCRKYQTDGRIPRDIAMALLRGAGARHWAKLTDPRVNWFIERGDEIEVWNYSKKNQTKEEIEENKLKARLRMRNVRANKQRTSPEQSANITRTFAERSSSSSISVSSDLSDGVQGGTSAPEPPVEPIPIRDPRQSDAGLFGLDLDAFVDGVKRATGRPCTRPAVFKSRDVARIVQAHATGILGPALADWIRHSAEAFAQTVDPAFGGFTIDRWGKWLDAGRPGYDPGEFEDLQSGVHAIAEPEESPIPEAVKRAAAAEAYKVLQAIGAK